jgi:hypothetical protein
MEIRKSVSGNCAHLAPTEHDDLIDPLTMKNGEITMVVGRHMNALPFVYALWLQFTRSGGQSADRFSLRDVRGGKRRL